MKNFKSLGQTKKMNFFIKEAWLDTHRFWPKYIFDCCNQSLKWLLYPSNHPLTNPSIHPSRTLIFQKQKSLFGVSFPFPLHQGNNTLSPRNCFTLLVNFLTACKKPVTSARLSWDLRLKNPDLCYGPITLIITIT